MRSAVLLVAVVAVAAACGNAVAGGAPEQTSSYRNEADGIAVEYPSRWVRSDQPTAAAFTGKAQLLNLSSRAPAAAEVGCSPFPWASMKDLRAGEFVLALYADASPPDEAATITRPDDLFGLSPMDAADLSSGCAVRGVAVRRADFWEDSRAITVILASRGSLDERDVRSVDEMWSSLVLSAVETPSGNAVEGRPYWHVLGTHCGVTGTYFNGTRWVPAEPVEADLTGPFDVGYAILRGGDLLYRSRLSGDYITFRKATTEEPDAPPCD